MKTNVMIQDYISCKYTKCIKDAPKLVKTSNKAHLGLALDPITTPYCVLSLMLALLHMVVLFAAPLTSIFACSYHYPEVCSL